MLSSRFVKGDLRGVTNSFFTHYEAVSYSNGQMQSNQKKSIAKKQTERPRGCANIYTIHTARGNGLVPIDNDIALFVEPRLLTIPTR